MKGCEKCQQYLDELDPRLVSVLGYHQALALKLKSDLDAGTIDLEWSEVFIRIFKISKNVDLTDYM